MPNAKSRSPRAKSADSSSSLENGVGEHAVSGADRGDGDTRPETSADQDLLLWALANGLRPAGGWFRTLQLRQRDLAALARRNSARFEHLRRMEVIGRLMASEQLAVLLRARLAEMLLAAKAPKDLAEAMRVFEKLPAGPPESSTVDSAGADIALDEGDLRATMDEARRLLRELDSDPAVQRLLGGPPSQDAEAPRC
jgi:hypothetical protein